ncbi:hypothetical protein PENTCL1PPCAC_18042, partial [Pristionchus entomophagus]
IRECQSPNRYPPLNLAFDWESNSLVLTALLNSLILSTTSSVTQSGCFNPWEISLVISYRLSTFSAVI